MIWSGAGRIAATQIGPIENQPQKPRINHSAATTVSGLREAHLRKLLTAS